MQYLTESLSEFVSLYSGAVDLNLRALKALQNAFERAAREYLAFLEASAGQVAPLAKAEQPKDFVAAQSALLEGVRDNLTTATKNLLKIQQETGAELKALVAEGMEKFSPEALGKLLKAA